MVKFLPMKNLTWWRKNVSRNSIKKSPINVTNYKAGLYINTYYICFSFYYLGLRHVCISIDLQEREIYCLIFKTPPQDCWGGILDTDYLFLVCYQKGYSHAINHISGILYRLQSCSSLAKFAEINFLYILCTSVYRKFLRFTFQ